MRKRSGRIIALALIMTMVLSTTTSFATVARFESSWGKNRPASFDYSDSYFDTSSEVYSDDIAIASMALSMAAGSKKETYITNALNNLGFAQIESNDYGKDGSYKSVGFAVGKKTLPDGKVLVAVFIRGANYTYEWGQNFITGLKGNAIGYDWPAKKVCSYVRSYIGDNKDVKIWISGYSRGGAICNLAAKSMADDYGKKNVYAYCFDSPRVAVNPDNTYTNIHCIKNRNDGIAMVMPEYLGFGIHGTEEECLYNAAYEDVMLKYLKDSTSASSLEEYLPASGTKWYRFQLNLDMSSVQALVASVKEIVNGRAFYEFVDEGYCQPEDVWDLTLKRLKRSLRSREKYVKSGIQDSLTAAALLVESTNETGQMDELAASLKNKKTLIKLASNLNLVKAVVRIARKKDPGLTNTQYKCIANTIYSSVIKDSSLNKSQKQLAKKALSGLVKPLLIFLAEDYRAEGNQVLGTLMSNDNLDRMMQNHYYEVNFAWLKARANNYKYVKR